MTIPLPLSSTEPDLFLLLCVRILALLWVTPIFGQRQVPALSRIGLAGALAYFMLHSELVAAPLPAPQPFILLLVYEALLGAVIGLMVRLTIVGMEMAGQVVAESMGLNMAQLLDPMTEVSVAVTGPFYGLLASLLFLALKGHHWLMLALTQTVQRVPVGTFRLHEQMFADLIAFFALIFTAAVRIALPVFGALLLTDLALALLARAIPQLHVWVIGLPLKGLVALLAMAALLPFMGPQISQFLQAGLAQLVNFLEMM